MCQCSFINVSSLREPLSHSLAEHWGRPLGWGLALLLFAHSIQFLSASMVQSSETPTIVFAVLLGILFIFLLLGTPTSSQQTLSWEGAAGSYGWRATLFPRFVKFDQGSWFSLLPAESIIRTLFFVTPAAFLQRKIFSFCHIKSV